MSVKRKILKNTAISGASQLIISVIAFALLPFMVTHLGAVEYGLIGFIRVFSVLGIMGVFDFGLKSATTKFVAQYKAENSEDCIPVIITSAFIFLLLVGLVLSIAGISISWRITSYLSVPDIYKADFRLALMVIFVLYAFELPGVIFTGAIEGFQRFDYLKTVEVIRWLLYAVLSVALILLGYGFLEIVISSVVLSFGQVLIYGYLTKKCIGESSSPSVFFSLSALKDCLKMGKYLFSAQVSSLLGHNAEKVLIAIMLTPAYMTMYEILIKLPRFIKSIMSFAGLAVMPAASELAAREDVERNKKLFLYGLRFNQVIAYPMLACAIFFSSNFLEVWVGKEYASLALLLQAMLLVHILNPVASFGWRVLLGMNRRVNYISHLQWIVTVVKLVILSWLLPVIGLWAVVLASWALVVTLPVSVFIFGKEFNLKIRLLIKDLAVMSMVSALPVLFFSTLSDSIEIVNIIHLIVAGIAWVCAVWSLFYLFVMDNASKQIVKSLFESFLRVSPVRSYDG